MPGPSRSGRLDAGARKALEIADTWEGAPLEDLTPEAAREEMKGQLVLAADPEPVVATEEIAVPRLDGDPLGLRLYRPSWDQELPMLIYFHGGGWSVGSIESHDGICRSLANAAEMLVLSIEYRLAPEHPFPAGLEDCLLAVDWVEANAKAVGGSAASVVVAGDSAGGNLAAAVCLRRRQLGMKMPRGQVLLYPGIDPTCGSDSHRLLGDAYFINRAVVAHFWSWYLPRPGQRSSALAAPLHASRLDGLPPTYVLTAEFDPLRDEGEMYARRLAAAGVEVTARRAEGQIHGFLTWDRYIPQAADVKQEVAAWLRGLGLAPSA